MKAMLRAFALVLMISPLPARADDAADRLALAEQVVVVAHVRDRMHDILPMMMAQLKPLVQQQGATDPADLDKFTKLFLAKAEAASDQFAEKTAELYAAEFSAEDLGNLLAFYKTPSGQNLLSKQPGIFKASFAIGKQLGQDLAKQVLEEMQKDKAAKPSKT